MPKEELTPHYNKFKENFRKAQEHYKGDDPAKLYAKTFERFINKLLEEKKK